MGKIVKKSWAKRKGLTFYYTGLWCVRGHQDERYVATDICRTCSRNRGKARNVANAVQNRQKVKEWIRANPEKRKAQVKRYKRRNKAKLAEANRAYAVRNRDRLNEQRRQWRNSLPDNGRSYNHRRRARVRGAAGSHTPEDFQSILRAQNWRCAYCRKSIKNGACIDHIMALAKGGSNGRDNLQGVCRSCNGRKSARDPIEFARSLGMLL